MKVEYDGFKLDAHREKSLGGDMLLYYSAFSVDCGWELTSGFSDDEDTEQTHIGHLKAAVDDYHLNRYDYDHSCDRDQDFID
jgi:hypothetical protein